MDTILRALSNSYDDVNYDDSTCQFKYLSTLNTLSVIGVLDEQCDPFSSNISAEEEDPIAAIGRLNRALKFEGQYLIVYQ